MSDYEIFQLGELELQSGQCLPGAFLAYKTFGSLNRTKSNAIVMPTYYTGTHEDNARIIGPGGVLDSERYFVVVPDMFGNGLSSSPSNTPAPYSGADFPAISLYDNVVCQRRLLSELWGIDEIALVIGWSMGAQQAFHWGSLYPGQVKAILPYCGSAKTSRHNIVFLEGVKAALTADAGWRGGYYTQAPVQGLKAFARVYAGWAYSPAFFRDGLYRLLGCASVEELLLLWEQDHLGWDANDLLAMLWTWQQADISANEIYRGDLPAALGAINAKAIVMPCLSDMYFPPQDSEFEVRHMANAECRPIDSPWGHIAGNPDKVPAVTAFLSQAVRDLL